MIVEKPAKTLLAHFQTQMCALRDRGGLRQSFDDANDALSLPRGVRGFPVRRAPPRATVAIGVRHEVEANQKNVAAAAVLRDLEQIDDALEARLTRERGRDVRELIGSIESTSIAPPPRIAAAAPSRAGASRCAHYR